LEAGRASSAIAPLLQSVRQHLAQGELALAQVSVAWLGRALESASTDASDTVRIEAALLEAQMARQQGRIDAASGRLAFAEEAAREQGDARWLAEILCEGSIVAYRAGELDVAVSRSREGETFATQERQPLLVACCLEVRGRAFTDRGEFQQAQSCFDDALAIYHEARAFRGVASCQLGLGWVAMTLGSLPVAHRHIAEARATCEQRELRVLSGVCMNMLGEIERQRGNLAESQRCYREAVRRHQSCGALATSMIAELNLALVHLQSDQYAEAHAMANVVLQSIHVSGARQFLAAVHLILLVCAAAGDRWSAWPMHFEAASVLLGESGQVHADLATLAQRAARLARETGHHEHASEAFGLAEQQWRRLGDEPHAERAKQDERLSAAACRD
jgi:tetratricopeptide (TPR) repeat protein